ncbi:protein ACCELERATED CELL DEATH 6-like [Eucalyptus grandis]|uniref:protein ACCELERATED CELL DEATH 6-like n=1 Tax=Eucalyptus grandis TaxID=71139 RepID=UPI00192EC325|nr:protein ACCELERATED CELL DEATH 6-like [Eucalyptus grandis]
MKNKKSENILHATAKGGDNNTVQCILKECGEPVFKKLANLKDISGNTPLHLASMNNHCQVMLSLVRNQRSDVKLLNNDKMTALDVAMNPESWSSPLLARAILFKAGVRIRQWPLVATVTFTAGFTLPGGYNASGDPHPGTAVILHNPVFQVFVISDMLAMHCSILGAVSLLWAHSSDPNVAEESYLLRALLLLMALSFTTVAFCAAVTVAVSKLIWLTTLVVYLTCVYLPICVLALAAFIFPQSPPAKLLFFIYYLAMTNQDHQSGD